MKLATIVFTLLSLYGLGEAVNSQGHLRTQNEDGRELQEVSCPCFDAEFLEKLPSPDDGISCRIGPMAAHWSTWSNDHSEFAHVYAGISKEARADHNVCRAWVFLDGQKVIFDTKLNLSAAQAQKCVDLIKDDGVGRGYNC